MKEFLIKNWYYIVLAVLAACSFIFSVYMAKKKGNSNLLDSVKEALLENMPYWIVISESMASGEDKRNNVISLGIALASKMLGKKLNADEIGYFEAFIKEQLEKVLATPQKKLQAAEINQKNKYRTK